MHLFVELFVSVRLSVSHSCERGFTEGIMYMKINASGLEALSPRCLNVRDLVTWFSVS